MSTGEAIFMSTGVELSTGAQLIVYLLVVFILILFCDRASHSPNSPGWLASKAQGAAFLQLHTAVIMSTRYHTRHFTWIRGWNSSCLQEPHFISFTMATVPVHTFIYLQTFWQTSGEPFFIRVILVKFRNDIRPLFYRQACCAQWC